ncbi:hypothetical protein Pint_23596 [Pistacia integerrima]|uniref:Uncharacterized protein n=1 Tax=Pistacia integerrima TaxID=434235 RepID=A0ACC0YHQ3_9ROSI|nr:hypothetical protein Pint_23596 [Pistacia integerrima]
MGETGIVRFPGNLDPRAQEFRPRNLTNNQTQFPVFRPPQVYYPYTHLSPYSSTDVQVVPFCDASGAGVGGLGYPQCHTQAAYVGSPSLPALPPPSAAPTRTLVLSSVASDVSESSVRRDLEVFGEVRGVQMDRVGEGILTVHFYDLRHAEMALREIREQHMQLQSMLGNQYCGLVLQNNCEGESLSTSFVSPTARGLIAGRPVWAQFILPSCNAVPDGNNQGTIVVFNLDSGVSSSSLREVFQAFGPVKELRETPFKKHQRFIEFYDIRDATKALKEMNGKEIFGKALVIEFSRPGGYNKKFFNAYSNTAIIPTTSTSNNITVTNPNTCMARNTDYNFSTHSSSTFPHSLVSQTQPLRKKSPSSSVKGNPNVNRVSSSTTSIEASVASLSLAGAVANAIDDGNPRRNARKSQSSHSMASIKQQQVKNRSNKPWKGRQMRKLDSRFLINEDAMVDSNCKDSRTTVMIKNIPNKYSQKLLLNMLDNHCIHCNEQIAEGDDQPLSSYDFVYLPIDFNNKCNVGYGFVNMTSPEATLRLYKAFHLQNWEVFNSRKICEVTYARVQGLEALKEHFKNSKFPSEMDHYLPVVFSPPRDGRQLTEPLPIVGQNKHQQLMMIDDSLTNPDTTCDDHDDDDDNDLDGGDTLDNNTNDSTDYADQNDLLIGGSCSSTNGGDDDRDNASVLVA